MVKIRLRRLGNKGRPFYRIVVAESTAGRNGAFVETIGQYDPVSQPKKLEVNSERALHWLLNGAEPTETVAILLNRSGVLGTYLEQRPSQKGKYKFLDTRTPATKAEAAPAKKEEAPVAEAAPVEAPAEEPAAEAAAE